jgi:phospholipid/cholesterol/gamma-HCH transport system ATP-binding protein
VEQGETVVLAGPSGMGKSVLLKLCVGLIRPTSGQIIINGEDISTMSEHGLNEMRQSIGMLFQNYGLFDSMTVAENVGFFLYEHSQKSHSEIQARIEEVLSQVNLEDVEHLKPSELSGGMMKRVSIARAIVHKPRIVYYDEPTAGLDPVTSDLINDLILNMREQYQVTSLSVSNSMQCAFKIGDRVGILYDGTLVEVAPPEQIKKSTNPIVHQFINGLEEGPITVF